VPTPHPTPRKNATPLTRERSAMRIPKYTCGQQGSTTKALAKPSTAAATASRMMQ